MLSHLKKAVLDNWQKWDLGPTPKDISLIRRTSSWLNGHGKEVYFIFRRGDTFPLLIAKCVSSRAFEDAILHEAQSTILLSKWIQKKSELTLPSPLCLIEINGFPVYIEKAIPGATLPEKIAQCWFERRKKIIVQKKAFELSRWLEDFYEVMETKKSPVTPAVFEKFFINPLNKFKSAHDLTFREKKYLSQIEDAARLLQSKQIVFPPVHGDLWGGSLLCGADDRLWIIDWEFFEPIGLPLHDLICFAVHPGFPINSHNGNGMRGEFMNLFRDSYFTDIVITFLHQHAQAAGLEPQFIELFFVLTLIKFSLERDQVSESNPGQSWRDLLGFYIENREHCRLIK